MFVKYLNHFQKAEAEWVQEVLDMHDGDEPKARAAVLASVDRIMAQGELSAFDQAIEACCFASRMWWPVGLARLRELGRVAEPTQ
jgi:hypothetical protein